MHCAISPYVMCHTCRPGANDLHCAIVLGTCATPAGQVLLTCTVRQLLLDHVACLQANTVIASDASRRAEAFTDVDVNLSGQAAQAFEPAPMQNGHALPAQARVLWSSVCLLEFPCFSPCPWYHVRR